MSLPAAAGLVHRTDEAQLASISQSDDSGLAVHKTAKVIRGHADRLPVSLQKGIQTAVPLPVQQRFGLQRALVPAAQHPAFPKLRHFQIVRVNVHVADNPYVGNVLQNFAGHLKQRTREIARNAHVTARAPEMPQQKTDIKPLGTRRKTADGHRLQTSLAKAQILQPRGQDLGRLAYGLLR